MKLMILGAGGYGRVVFELAEQTGRYSDIFFLDDNSTHEKVVGCCADYKKHIAMDTEFYPAFGNNEARILWLDRFEMAGAKLLTLVDPSAYVSPSAEIGEGTIVLPRAVVNTNVKICRGCIINCGAVIDHDCIIGEGVHICLNAVVKAENRVPGLIKLDACAVIENRHYPLHEDEA